MRSAGNFHPEWGYLAPAPSFMRTARIVLVATAIGATAGAAVIISLVQRPASDAANTSIAAHALVTSVSVVAEPPASAAAADEPALAQPPIPSTVAATPSPAPANGPLAGNGASAKANPISPPPAQGTGSGVAALSEPASAMATNAESPPAAAPDEATAEPDATVKATKKHRTAAQPAPKRGRNNRPFAPLFRIFSSSSAPRSSF